MKFGNEEESRKGRLGMAKKIDTWTIGTNTEGGVQLNIFIDGVHYTLEVHDKDVLSMQNTVILKPLLGRKSTEITSSSEES